MPKASRDSLKVISSHLFGMEMGMLWSLRMVVLIGEMRSTKPTTTELPEDVLSSTLSPTTKGRDTNCSTGQPICLTCAKTQLRRHMHRPLPLLPQVAAQYQLQ